MSAIYNATTSCFNPLLSLKLAIVKIELCLTILQEQRAIIDDLKKDPYNPSKFSQHVVLVELVF